jgi:sulfotransferase family protein
MPLRVIGAGFGRTGTLTQKVALEQLGFSPCHHMIEVFGHPEQTEVFIRAARGEAVDWDDVYSDYAATVDAPGCVFWRQLMDRYPDAPVLLSVRDSERWCDSFEATIGKVFAREITPPVPNAEQWRTMLDELRRCTFGDEYDDRASLIAGYERHNDAVRAGVPADRLIEYHVADGWAPLCAALGVPVPDAPFPRTNTREEWMQMPQ